MLYMNKQTRMTTSISNEAFEKKRKKKLKNVR